MAGYTIYIPGVSAANPSHLDRVGLSDLKADRHPEYADILRDGPDGGSGVLALWRTGDPATDPHVSVGKQEWKPAKPDHARELPAGRFWIGIDKERPVMPADIKRAKPFAGHNVLLADGHQWSIPIAVRLPHRLGLSDSTGEFERRIDEQYQKFYKMADGYALQIFSEVDQLDLLREARPDLAPDEAICSVVLQDAWEFSCCALSLNYRLTPELIDFLGLLDDQSIIGVIIATTDLQTIYEVRAQKKTYSPVGIPVT